MNAMTWARGGGPNGLALWWLLLLPPLLALPLLGACRSSQEPAQRVVSSEPLEIGVAECATCGMVVREQPAPRAQLIHRDGTRAYFCSLGDLIQYIQAPSPHGKPIQVYGEVLSPSSSVTERSLAAHPWAAVAGLTYVVGVERPGVMGTPVLSYGDRSDAVRIAGEVGGRVVGWGGLKAFVLSPPAKVPERPGAVGLGP